VTTLAALPTPIDACAAGPPVRLRPPEDFCLPAGYRQQDGAATRDDAGPMEGDGAYWNAERIAASARWQHHAYAWAARLAVRRGLASVLDVGCGPGTKLSRLIAPACADVEGIDQPSAIDAARRLGHAGVYRTVDLERPDAVAPWRAFDLIICSDVIEHLLDPGPCLRLIRRLCHAGSLVLISTPDRARLRGRACMASDKPEHVREWTAPELRRYLGMNGLRVVRTRMLPADDAPVRRGMLRELAWRARLVETSPHRCMTVLCRPDAAGPGA
jgi:SAM-dependent methyltransferase